MLDIAIGIAERGLAVDLILVRAEGPYLELLPPEVRLVDLAAQRALTSVPRLVRYLRRQRPSVLIATLPETSVIAMVAMKLVGVPVPLIVRRASNFTMEYASSGFKERMTLKIEKAMLPSATAVVVNSPGVAEDLNRRAPRASDRVRVIHNPVVWPDHLERAAMPVDHAWLEDPQTPVVLSAGRLVSPKDHATLLRAFAEVATMRPARLVLLGDGPQRDDLTKLAEELRIAHVVDFAGFQINPIAYMSKAAVFVLSSEYEGSPNVLIQAMACGTQVVSTDCPSGPREILEGGRWGRLVPVADMHALAAAIIAAIDNPIDAAQLMFRANDFCAESSIDGYLDVISSATGVTK